MERIWGENECFLTTDDGDNDQDWYRVEIGSNCQLSIALTDSPSALDLNMELYRIDNGEVVLVADDGDTNSTAGQELFIDLDVPQGIYYIQVEDEGNNNTSQELYSLCIDCNSTVATDDVEAAKVLLSPNPFYEKVNIYDIELYSEYVITDSFGNIKVQSTFTSYALDLSHLSSGIYFISIPVDDKLITKKIIKM